MPEPDRTLTTYPHGHSVDYTFDRKQAEEIGWNAFNYAWTHTPTGTGVCGKFHTQHVSRGVKAIFCASITDAALLLDWWSGGCFSFKLEK